MLVDATLLIQDVQLLCFTVVFGVLALQQWGDRSRRWLWYSFLANTAGAVFDLLGPRLPAWIHYGVNEEMIPLSYALLNVALAVFQRRGRRAAWISGLVLLAGLPVFLAWRNVPGHVRSDALGDLLIALECVVTVVLLLGGGERWTRAPRLLMGWFLAGFTVVELARVWVAFGLHRNPDVSTPGLEMVSAVAYIVNTSLLPPAFIWMMHARLEGELVQQSIIDVLTGVLNRRGLEQALTRELARCRRYDEELTLAMLDLDHFKVVNDRHGHAAGDRILRNVAGLLSGRLRETDVVGRFGGEEFVLLLPHTTMEQAAPMLEDLCDVLPKGAGVLPASEVRVTASLGVTSTAGRRGMGGAELLEEADVALYRAKERGRDQMCVFEAEWGVKKDGAAARSDAGYPFGRRDG